MTYAFIDWFFPILNTVLIICATIAGIGLFLWQNAQFMKRQKKLESSFNKRQKELIEQQLSTYIADEVAEEKKL